MDPALTLGEHVRRAIVAAFGEQHAGVDPQVARSDRADLQSNVALGLARRVGAQPRKVAETIAEALRATDLVERVEVAGAGFLNITLSDPWIDEATTRVAADERLGVPRTETPDRVVIDYSSPNVAKEMHVGHLRSTNIGDALARVLAWRGHTVIRQNHLGDWGTPFGMLIEHFIDVGQEQAERALAVGELTAFYRAARAKFDDDPAFAARSRNRVVQLQAGDPQSRAWWRGLLETSLGYVERLYTELGVTLTPADVCPESFHNERLGPLADELAASSAAQISDGALCLFVPGFQNREGGPLPLIVRKRDGGFGYHTTDLAAIRYRLAELGGTRLIYVIGAPQTQHLAMIKAAAIQVGWLAPPARMEHVAFGSVLGTDGKMLRTREGQSIRLVDLIAEAIAHAEEEVAARCPDLDAETRRGIARNLGIGAIKYADLSSDRIKDYIYDPRQMVSLVGDTVGYLQYAHARVRGVFRNAGGDTGGAIVVREPAERTLARRVLDFPGVVLSVERTLEPHHLAGYLYDLATEFNLFYDACPILIASDDVRASRLALAGVTGRVLARGLDLLGIAATERM